MSTSPKIVQAFPADKAIGIVLGTSIVVTFDQPIDTTTITEATFAVFGPGPTQVLTPNALLASIPTVSNNNQALPGTFTFSTNTDGNTVLTFVPLLPFRPNVTFTVLAVGPGSSTGKSILGTNGETLDADYQWTFVTGSLNVSVPPVQSPLPLVFPLDPASVRVKQHIFPAGNDLTQQIDLVFPGAIDPNSFSLSEIICYLEALLNDSSVVVPSGLSTTASISGNTLSVRITGWPAS